MTSQRSIEKKYQKLTDVEHVLLRPNRYIGAKEPVTAKTWVVEGGKMVERELSWAPGFLKLFDEIISNSVDFSKTPEGARLDAVKVEIDRKTGMISVEDNGGIPVVIHGEYGEHIPTMIFGYLRSGSNFNDDDKDAAADLTGQNGEGASLTNIFSTEFTVETCDGKKAFKQTWSNNMRQVTEPKIRDGAKGFTRITYTPDYAHLKVTLDDGNYAKLVKRVYDVAACNPRLKVFLNGERIQVKSFEDYIHLYGKDFIYEANSDWQIGVARSEDGLQHVSFVNSTETTIGGTHVDYVAYQLANQLRELIKRKNKIDLKPSDIFAHFHLFINARIHRPRYNSQTKENLTTAVKEFGTSWAPSDRMVKEIHKSEIVQAIIRWHEAKTLVKEREQLKDLDKEADKTPARRIVKLQDANWAGKHPQKCILFLTEGDSAAKVGKSTGDRDRMGFLPLRGKPLNVSSAKVSKITANEEFFNIMVAMGLKIGEPVKSIHQLRYAKIGLMTDADHDGAHIQGLLINNFHRFWPELFKLGVIHRFMTPIVKVWVGNSKKPLSFYEIKDFKEWEEKHKGTKYRSKYYKGLATSQDEEFTEYFQSINDHLIRIEARSQDDHDVIELVFSKAYGSSDKRKEWLKLTDDDVETLDIESAEEVE